MDEHEQCIMEEVELRAERDAALARVKELEEQVADRGDRLTSMVAQNKRLMARVAKLEAALRRIAYEYSSRGVWGDIEIAREALKP